MQTKSQREITYTPVFAENLFRFGSLSITPGVRFEGIRQDVRETVNVAKTSAGRALAARDDAQRVPLFGVARPLRTIRPIGRKHSTDDLSFASLLTRIVVFSDLLADSSRAAVFMPSPNAVY